MGLESVIITFTKGNHLEDYDENGYDMLAWYVGALEDFIFVLDTDMNLVILDSNNVQVVQNASCYGYENRNTQISIDLFNKLKKYFNAVNLLKSIVKFDVDDNCNVNKDYLKNHINYYNNELKSTIE